MIYLTDENKIILNGHSSKGDQFKFRKDNIWYKTDFLGYEGLSEVVVSNLLKQSNIEDFVIYQEELISYKGDTYTGCKSENFIPEGSEFITLYRLFKNEYGCSPSELKNDNLSEYIKNVIYKTAKITNLSIDKIGIYFTKLLELDAFTLNDDRHFNNIGFIYNNDNFIPAPIFDNGAGLLSDEMFGPDIDNLYKLEAKPFSKDFDEQKDILEELYGNQIQFGDIDFNKLIPKESIYNINQINKIKNIIENQIYKYPDLLNNHDLY